MEANKDLAITLIQADLRHNQLISGLESLDFETNSYFLDLHKPVAQLMGLGDTASEQWFQIYDHYLQKAHKYPVSSSPNSLRSVAEECYNMLLAYAEIEKHLNPDD